MPPRLPVRWTRLASCLCACACATRSHTLRGSPRHLHSVESSLLSEADVFTVDNSSLTGKSTIGFNHWLGTSDVELGWNATLFANTMDTHAKQKSRSPPPVLHFLFLTRAGLERLDLWEAFFLGWRGKYRAYMHCTDHVTCRSQLAFGSNKIGIMQVATVPTIYCKDLVSAMHRLVVAALPSSPGSASAINDKFIFVSETTLPVKPFPYIYASLTRNRASDFCVAPSSKWPQGFNFHIVKHSQWVVLNREHAEVLRNNWPQIKSHSSSELWTVPLLNSRTGAVEGVGRLHANGICTDEWAIFASIFGAIRNPKILNDPQLNPHPLYPNAVQPQGQCHTFAFWDEDGGMMAHDSLVNKLRLDPGSKLSCAAGTQASAYNMPDCASSHPVSIDALSPAGARAFRRSPFLFARKFRALAISEPVFRSIILQ